MLETPVKPKTAREILEGAHRIMSERGQCKHRFFDYEDGSLCTFAALALADGRDPTSYGSPWTMQNVSPELATAMRALGFALPGEACTFNNQEDTTKETVLAKFREGLAEL